MAFVDPTQPGEDENDQNPSQTDQALNPSSSQQTQQQSQSETAPPSTSAGGAGVASGASGGGSAPSAGASAPKPSSSGSWTNLDSYLNANADQATGVGQQIAQTVNNSGNQAQSDINNLGSGFTSAVNQNIVNQDPDAVNKAVTDASSLTAGQTLGSDDQQAFNQQANATYSGPTDVTAFNGYNQAQQDVLTANQKAQQTETEAGRGTLLNDQFANSSQYGYNQGENNLDQLLLQNSEGGQAALQPLASQWSGLNGALNNTVSAGSDAATKASATDAATAQNAKNTLATASSNFQTQLQTGLANLEATNNGSYDQLIADLKSGNATDAEYQAIGVNPPSQQNPANFPDASHNYLVQPDELTGYVQQGQTPTLASYATTDQYAQAAALAQLAGQQVSPLLAPGTISQAGTAQTSPAYTFDKTQYGADNQTAQGEYQGSTNSILSQVNDGIPNPGISGGKSVFGPPVTNVQDAVAQLNAMIQKGISDANYRAANNGFSSFGSLSASQAVAQAAARAQQLMNAINQNQAQYGLPQFSIAGQDVSVTK